MNEGLVMVIVALTSGAGGVFINRFIPSKDKEIDAATSVRQELYKMSTDLRQEMRKLEGELDTWKGKYYELMREYNALHTMHAEQKATNELNVQKMITMSGKINTLNREIEKLKKKE